MQQVFPIGANLFFWPYICIGMLVLFNMVIGIVCAAYDDATSHSNGARIDGIVLAL